MKTVIVKNNKEYIPGLSIVRVKDGEFNIYFSDNGRSAWGNLNYYDQTSVFEPKEMTSEEIKDHIGMELAEISERFKSGDFGKSRESHIELKGRLRRISDNNFLLFREKINDT